MFIVVVLIIWIIAAFIYKSVKDIGFFEAFFTIPLKLVQAIFAAGASSSTLNDAKAKAKRSGNMDAYNQINAKQQEMKAHADNLKNYDKASDFIDSLSSNENGEE